MVTTEFLILSFLLLIRIDDIEDNSKLRRGIPGNDTKSHDIVM